MKLPFKYIAILVVISLAGIFAYQAYWLTSLYHTMHSEMERDITEAMRMSDYNEMMIRGNDSFLKRERQFPQVGTAVTTSGEPLISPSMR